MDGVRWGSALLPVAITVLFLNLVERSRDFFSGAPVKEALKSSARAQRLHYPVKIIGLGEEELPPAAVKAPRVLPSSVQPQ